MRAPVAARGRVRGCPHPGKPTGDGAPGARGAGMKVLLLPHGKIPHLTAGAESYVVWALTVTQSLAPFRPGREINTPTSSPGNAEQADSSTPGCRAPEGWRITNGLGAQREGSCREEGGVTNRR